MLFACIAKTLGHRPETHVKTNRKQEWILATFIAMEVVLFSFTGRNFFSVTNFFDVFGWRLRLVAGVGADAGDCDGRYRSLGWLHDGPLRRASLERCGAMRTSRLC